VEQFDAALDQLGVAHIHVKSALIDLHEMQLVSFDGRHLVSMDAWGRSSCVASFAG
jgi:hypothetical protein